MPEFLVSSQLHMRSCRLPDRQRFPALRSARFATTTAAKRSSLDGRVIPSLTTASQLSKALQQVGSRNTAITLTALQHLARLQQHTNHGVPQQEQQQRARLTTKLLAQLAPRIARLPVGSLCRLAFVLSRLRGVANITPLWQAVLRQLTALAEAAAASPTPSTVSSSSTHPARSEPARPQPASAAPPAAGLFSTAGAPSPGELLYLLRALANFSPDLQQEEPQQAAVLLEAVVAAARAMQDEFPTEDLLLLATALARLNYHDSQLLAASSSRFIQAVSAPDQQLAAAAAAPLPLPPQEQLTSSSETCGQALNDQVIVNFLWATASLGHADEHLLEAALHWLLVRPPSLPPAPSQQQQQSGHSSVLMLPIRLVPMLAWALAAQLVLVLDGLGTCGSDSGSDSGSSCESSHRHSEAAMLVQVTAAAHELLERAAATPADKQRPFSAEALAQLHHAGLLIRAAAAWAGSMQPEAAVGTEAAVGRQALAGLLSWAREQQQQHAALQQAREATEQLLLVLQQQCRAAWKSNRLSTSFLQLQVCQALEQLGLQPQLEVPAAPLHTNAQRQQLLRRLLPRAADGAVTAAANQGGGSAAEESDSCQVVDIACAMPAATFRSLQEAGLSATMQQQRQQQAQPPEQQHPELKGMPQTVAPLSGDCSSQDCWLLVAVEVDGPSHAAVNDRSRPLGRTVCRNWMLCRMGWRLLVVPGWEL